MEDWISTGKRMKMDAYVIAYTKVNSKWNKDLNIRFETIKLIEKKREK